MSDNFENNSNGFEPNENDVNNDVYSKHDAFSSANETDSGETFEAKVEDNTHAPEQPQYNGYGSQPSQNPYNTGNETQFSPDGYYHYSKPQQNAYGTQNNQQSQSQPQQQQQQYYQFGQQPSSPYNFNQPAPSGGNKKSSNGKKAAAIIIVAAVVIAVFAIVTALFSVNDSGKANKTTTINQPIESTSSAFAQNTTDSAELTQASAATQQLSAVDVAEKARKSVVGVMTYASGQLSGEGSGVVMGVDSSKKYTYIITCAHVINAKGVTYRVLTLDGKGYDAQLVAADSRTDIGVLKVEATDLPIAEFGDSTALKVGETVYAIGNPGGSEYFGSMTDGIISAIDRSINNTYNMTCIQHNAAINPGNSGGALVNSAGQVIGINSSKISATDYEGMGFAIPMAIVKPIVDSLIQYGYVPNRPKLGIEYASVNDYQLYSMVVAIKGLPAGSLVIAGISNDSSLANTQAQVGDLIIGVNGKPMDSSDTLLDLISTGNVGDSITLNLCRVENRTYKITKFDVTIKLVEDRGNTEEETTVQSSGGYNHGGASSFEDFFEQYFGSFGR